jgi:hypothetical protein
MPNLMRALIRTLFGEQSAAPTHHSPATDSAPAATPIVSQTAPTPATRITQPTGGTPTTELDVRIQILNSFLTTPHGKLADFAPLHIGALDRDPLFYGHLAAWYTGRGVVRDHKVLFVANLLTFVFP